FHTRWALSYLSGPLSRAQISRLMEGRRPVATEATSQGDHSDVASSAPPPHAAARPLLAADVPQCFAVVSGERPLEAKLAYRPGLVGEAKLHFVKANEDIDVWRDVVAVERCFDDELSPRRWDEAMTFPRETGPRLTDRPEDEGAVYADLPSELTQAKNYRGWEKELKDWLYQSERLRFHRCETLDERSEPDEAEAEFRIRITQTAREQRDAKKEDVRKKFAVRIKRQEEAVAKAEADVEEQKSQFWAKIGQMLFRVLEVLLLRTVGSRSRKQIVTSTSATQAMRERRQSSRASDRLEAEQAELADLQAQMQAELDHVDLGFDPSRLAIEPVEVGPRKADISVHRLALVWLPWWEKRDGTREPAY
ncbi:MAG: hypothetical protein KDA61_17325, partial [Planctomycetales bacterium]|nr:hypothetical protein [Planctomycetales bacterium]